MEPVIAKHIDRTPGVRGGKPCVVGTRISVSDIVIWSEQGKSPEEIVTDFSQLSLADVHAALAFYYDHREEIEREISESEALAETMRQEARRP